MSARAIEPAPTHLLKQNALQSLHPAEHAELYGKLKESEDRGTIEAALETLSAAVSARGLEGVDFSGRPKNLYGVMRKMKDKHKGLNQVYDVRALRVVVKSKHDCYAVLQEVSLQSQSKPASFAVQPHARDSADARLFLQYNRTLVHKAGSKMTKVDEVVDLTSGVDQGVNLFDRK